MSAIFKIEKNTLEYFNLDQALKKQLLSAWVGLSMCTEVPKSRGLTISKS